jgi:hypothetical protein
MAAYEFECSKSAADPIFTIPDTLRHIALAA